MKLKILSFSLVFSMIFMACGGEEPNPRNRKVTRYIERENSQSRAASGEVYCTVSGNDCWEWIGSEDEVFYNRANQAYSNFLQDYARNDLNHFFQTTDVAYLFPEGCPVDQENINKVASGQYATKVMADNSIVIFNNNKSLDLDHIVFVIKR